MSDRTTENPVEQVYKALRRIEETVPKGANGTVQRIMREVAESHEPLRQASIWYNQNVTEMQHANEDLTDRCGELNEERDEALARVYTVTASARRWRRVAVLGVAATGSLVFALAFVEGFIL